MIQTMVLAAILAARLSTAGAAPAANGSVETQHLSVSDATGALSNERLKSLADQAEATVARILAFWSADAGTDRWGKIRLVFDPPRREVYSSVFFWEKRGGERVRVVRVFGADGAPQMMAHKLTSAIFPQQDKLIRNLMGILTESRLGNPLTFPMCGFCSDEWVVSFLDRKTYIPLGELGPDHESWGMKDAGGGQLSILDKARQHRAYAEAGSFGNYLYDAYGIGRIKKLQKLSQEKERPWQDAFGASLQKLEADWHERLQANRKSGEKNISTLSGLVEKYPSTACSEAQKRAPR